VDPDRDGSVDGGFRCRRLVRPRATRLIVANGLDAVGERSQFELGLARPPSEARQLATAVQAASDGIEHAGWRVLATEESPVRGGRGAIEFLLHARRPDD